MEKCFSKFIVITILLIGSMPTSFGHSCAMETQNITNSISQNIKQMPCHDDSSQQDVTSCECANCACPDVCNNINVYSIEACSVLRFYGFNQLKTSNGAETTIPVKPVTPLLRPPIFS